MADGLGAWRTSPEGVELVRQDDQAMVRLGPPEGRRVTILAHVLAHRDSFDALRAALDLKAAGLARGAEDWQLGRVQVWAFDTANRYLWYWPKDVTSLSGTSDWRGFGATIPLAREVASAYLVIYNGAVSGAMWARNVHVAGLRERTAFRILRYLLLTAWIGAAVWIAAALVRAKEAGRLRYALLAAAFVTLAGVLTPQPYFTNLVAPIEAAARHSLLGYEAREVSAPTAGPARDAVPRGPGPAPGIVAATARNLGFKAAGHATAFAALTVLALLAFPKVAPLRCVVYLVLLAAASESVQRFVVSRSSQSADLAVDLVGVALAAGAILLLRRAIRSVRARP